jgi:hypothetical protein
MPDSSAPDALAAALRAAERASPASRIDHRDALAAYGVAVVQPLIEWLRAKRHPNFVIRVFEALGRSDLDAALAALDSAVRIDPSLAADVAAARRRLTDAPAPPARHRARTVRDRRSGVLDQVTPFGPPPSAGDCMGITNKGLPCPNPGRYWVGEKLSCSRNHGRYR